MLYIVSFSQTGTVKGKYVVASTSITVGNEVLTQSKIASYNAAVIAVNDTTNKLVTKYALRQSEADQAAINQDLYNQVTYLLELINSQTTPLPGIYVSTTIGNDTSGIGSYLTPYRTIQKAYTQATPNSTIRLLAGSYTIASQIEWSIAGVDLIGENKDLVTVHCRVAANYAISMYSASVVTGDHIFAGITFTGDNLTGFAAIQAVRYNNVVVHDCNFEDFSEEAVYYGNTIPTVTYCTGNKVYNCYFDNCSAYDANGSPGVIGIKGQDGFLCYNNTIDMPVRGATPPGFGIKTNYTKGLKVYDNSISIPANDDAANWSFCMELLNTSDECEIYRNTFAGPVDFAGDFCVKGSGTWSAKLYSNHFGHSSLQSVARVGILLESESTTGTKDMYIYDNDFTNLETAITITSRGSETVFDNLNIYRNTFTGIGISSNTTSGAAIGANGNAGFTLSNLYVYNNTILSGRGTNTLKGIVLPTRGTVTNVYLRNNIISSFGYALTSGSTASGTIANVFIQNNCFYNNGGSNEPVWDGVTPTSITKTSLLKSDPLLTGFILGTGSPAINYGMNVGLPYLGTAPDLGAFEKE